MSKQRSQSNYARDKMHRKPMTFQTSWPISAFDESVKGFSRKTIGGSREIYALG